MYYLADFVTKQRVEPTNLVFTGEKGPWEVVMDLDEVRKKINIDYFQKAPPLASKYLPFMPIRDYANFVSLSEGGTPLIRSKVLGKRLGIDLWFKVEPQNPTGSFKDRGSAVDLSIAKEMGAKAIAVASTGNMAASCSCYAAAAQIPCFVFVPEGTPPSKLSQVIGFGGKIVQVKGAYNDAARLAQRVAEELGFYLAGDYAFRVEGQKTAAYEIIDQSFFQAPDAVVVPVGCGTNLAAYARGFRDYQALGFIERLPQLVAVQAEGASSVVQSVVKRSDRIEALTSIDTIATAIAVGNPLDGLKALDAVYSTGGAALAVSDREMLEAQYELSREEGLFVECSSASGIAALMKLAKDGRYAGKRVVCVLTGDGLKDPASILKVALKPPTIYPEVREFLSLYENSFFKGKNVAFFDKSEVVFSKDPSVADVQARLQAFFNTRYSDAHAEAIRDVVCKFLKKGKPITFSDFQDIIQNALEAVKSSGAVEPLTVLDFEIRAGRDKQSEAKVVVRVGSEEVSERAFGVGPVDAVINALRKACGGKMSFQLTSYKVDIRNAGTDAVVNVETILSRNARPSAGQGTSPDIIQASIEAFVEAYNGLA